MVKLSSHVQTNFLKYLIIVIYESTILFPLFNIYLFAIGFLFLIIRTVGPFIRFIPLTWYFEFQLLGDCHCWWTSESPRAHVARFYGRLRLIRSVLRVSKFSVFKLDWNCNFVDLLHHPFWLQLILALFQLFKLHIWPRITDEGSVPEMRIWSITLI